LLIRSNICLALLFSLFLGTKMRSQSFYEQVMNQNISLVDTSMDVMELERTGGVFARLSKSYDKEWPPVYYHALVYARLADLVMETDTSSAKLKITMARRSLVKSDTLKKGEAENKILDAYLKILEARAARADAKKLKETETALAALKKSYPSNPRLSTLYGYYYMIFYPNDKKMKLKAQEQLNTALKLYVKQKPAEYAPAWGKKWSETLLKKAGK